MREGSNLYPAVRYCRRCHTRKWCRLRGTLLWLCSPCWNEVGRVIPPELEPYDRGSDAT